MVILVGVVVTWSYWWEWWGCDVVILVDAVVKVDSWCIGVVVLVGLWM